MKISEEALRAASEEFAFWESCEDGKGGECLTCDYESQRILEAAMPHIRKQIAQEIRDGVSDYRGQLIEHAARISEGIMDVKTDTSITKQNTAKKQCNKP